MSHPLSRAAAVALAALLAAAPLTACSDDDEQVSTSPVVAPGRPGEDATVLPPGTTFEPRDDEFNAADVEFVSGMIPHHEQAVTMAQLAPGRAQHPSVVGLASRIADVQGPEIEVYRTWLKDRDLSEDGRAGADDGHGGDHGGSHGSGAAVHGMATEAELDKLEDAKGSDFDRMFLQLMIRHHEGALQMARERERAGGIDIRASELAADVAVTQLDEINRMAALLSEV